jgi:transcriptional regulator with PAS, ATPase and Fis domain
MNPIVNEFVSTNDSIFSIIEKNINKSSFLEVVFLKILNAKVVGFDQKLFEDLDQAIIKGHLEPNVYLLFISTAIRFTCVRKQIARAKAIQSIGESLSRENIHPLVEAQFKQAVATLKFFEYNRAECNFIAKESLASIDKSLPRYIGLLLNFATLVSLQGRLKELDKIDLELLDSLKNGKWAFNRCGLLLSNCIWTGNYKQGLVLQEEYKKNHKNDGTNVVQVQENILKILSGDLNENNYQDNLTRLYVNSLYYLKSGDIEKAKLNFQLLQKEEKISIIDFPFEEYLPLHIELSQKNIGKSKLMLHEVIQKRGQHYLDDLFLARIQLLETDMTGAVESFNRLLLNVKRYGAMPRLLFELQFAKELKTTDLLLLMNGTQEDQELPALELSHIPAISPRKDNKGIQLLIGESVALYQVKQLVKKFAILKEPVLITGETGTGKELISRAIHDEGSHPHEPFLAINCGALTESLLQSELFGYVAGAFTGAQKERQGIFEAAGKGTVFLDEFGEISPQMQVSMLRVLASNEIRMIGGTKNRQIECKIVIATNINLHQAVKDKKFREDLYFRLARFDINIPPLRERSEDIPLLIEYFLNRDIDQIEKVQRISQELQQALVNYRWPGNIRELKNEIERLKILHVDKKILSIEDFDFTRLHEMPIPKANNENVQSVNLAKVPKSNNQEIVLDHERILKIVQRGSKSENRQKILKELFQTYKKLTRIQIVEILAINPGSISKELQILCKIDFIKKITPTKSVKSHYFILK